MSTWNSVDARRAQPQSKDRKPSGNFVRFFAFDAGAPMRAAAARLRSFPISEFLHAVALGMRMSMGQDRSLTLRPVPVRSQARRPRHRANDVAGRIGSWH